MINLIEGIKKVICLEKIVANEADIDVNEQRIPNRSPRRVNILPRLVPLIEKIRPPRLAYL